MPGTISGSWYFCDKGIGRETKTWIDIVSYGVYLRSLLSTGGLPASERSSHVNK